MPSSNSEVKALSVIAPKVLNVLSEKLREVTQNYKPPMPKDLPMKFNFKFQRNRPNPIGVLRSKAVAEPALTMASSALLAVKHAIEAARADGGHTEFFALGKERNARRIGISFYLTIPEF
ncbi:xanthine dehydrogenase [Elysia marginata]|uniref:Xanthine dehydrogenase n=1 Tax=Elysia marginata TaxID=1093978 RepID=A0AAV4F2P3_9GAST|nr:xanthine dehydrogenase [Elysia marginata]